MSTRALLQYPFAFTLLAVIASRARYTHEANDQNLQFGEAHVGDYGEYGMTRGQYRKALGRLVRLGLIEVRPINGLGTVARLKDSRIFSLRDERQPTKRSQPRSQPLDRHPPEAKMENGASSGASLGASSVPAPSQLGASNQKGKKEKNEKEGSSESIHQPACAGGDPSEAIYLEYPKKVGRAEALAAIRKAITGGQPPAQLLAQTRAYAAAVGRWNVADRQFIPNPATWFNRGSFDDDPAAWERSYGLNNNHVPAPTAADHAADSWSALEP